jgi:hypothetical protein
LPNSGDSSESKSQEAADRKKRAALDDQTPDDEYGDDAVVPDNEDFDDEYPGENEHAETDQGEEDTPG